jgi:hypothetical protein
MRKNRQVRITASKLNDSHMIQAIHDMHFMII